MDRKEKQRYLKERFFKEFKRNFSNHNSKKLTCDIAENDKILNLTIMLGEATQAIFVTYSKSGDSMLASYIRPSAMTNSTNEELSKLNDKILSSITSTLEPVFGKPFVSYDSTNDVLGVILSSTFEWVQKEKEAETIREIRQGKGLDVFEKVFNIKDLREDQSGGESNI